LCDVLRKLLVPVDFTPKNDRALRAARELAEAAEGEVVLLHVIETLEDELDDDLERFYERLEQKAEQKLQESLAKLGDGAFARHSTLVRGHRARAVADFAEKQGVDAIVLSSHRVDPDRPGAEWMTISYKIAILARCPVLLVK